MTTPDPRDERREDARRLRRAVRAASGPELGDGAARRIADGAWERAGMATAARPRRRRISPALRRWAVAAAALVAVGTAVFALRPTEPVFAVEGEPVKVWKDDGWQETRRVHPGATVFVADGVRALRGRGALAGEDIVPDPGATFRIVASQTGDRTIVVQLLGGAAEVRGDALRLSLADVEVTPRDAKAAGFQAWASLPAGTDDDAPPPAAVDAARAALGRIRIRLGDATLVRRSTGERLELGGQEMAALLPVRAEGRTVYRLSRLRRFEPTLGVHIASGHPVLDVRESRDGAIAVLAGPDDGVTGVAIDRAELPAALDQIHAAMLVFATRAPGEGGAGGVRRHVLVVGERPPAGASLETRAAASGQTLTEVSVTRDGSSLRALLHGDGRVEIERDGTLHEYDSLDAAQAADAEAAALLRGYVER